MPDVSLSPLAARALERLQKLADGNGLAPDAIKLLGTEEKVYAINGTMKLEPLAEVLPGRAAGAASTQTLGNFVALQSEAGRRQKEFREGADWIPAVLKQLKEQPAEGWGLDDVKIPLPEKSAVLAATEPCPSCGGSKMLTCPQCNGQGGSTCNHCHGARQEFCYVCAGHGVNPANPNQPCIHCNGRRYIPCRFCQATGVTVCPVCRGQRGVSCSTCRGVGSVTQEITLSFGARSQFLITGSGELPSGLRRGLDRVGIANLANGYADIETAAPPEEKDSEALHKVPGLEPELTPAKEKAPSPELHYIAHLPYADLRMSFNGKAALVSAFGKRCALLGVPAFLDVALEQWRDKLRKSAGGEGAIDDALGARAIRDALMLQLGGKTDMRELRKLYPLGLSNETAQEIITNLRLALSRTTVRVRVAIAIVCGLLGTASFAGLFFTPFNEQLTQNLPPMAGLAIDVIVLALACGLSWLALASSTSFTLRKRFPDTHIPLVQKIGKTGYAMLGSIVVLFVAAVFIAPVKPGWLTLFTR